MNKAGLLYAMIVLLFTQFVGAQERYSVQVVVLEHEKSIWSEGVSNQPHVADLSKQTTADPVQLTFRDSISCVRYLQKVLDTMMCMGYIGASLDSIDQQRFKFRAGKRYTRLRTVLQIDSVLFPLLQTKNLFFVDTMMYPSGLYQYRKALFRLLENNGYPLVFIRVIEVSESDFTCLLQVKTGPKVYFKEVTAEGFTQAFTQHLAGLSKGELYSHERLLQVQNHLQKSNLLVKQQGTPTVQFLGDAASVKLKLLPVEPSRFDFVLGFLPNASGRSTITGTLDAGLFNTFRSAERITMHFERLRPQTQELIIDAQIPYVGKLPFGAGAKMQLYRRDSQFLDVTLQGRMMYPISYRGILEIGWQRNTSQLLRLDTNQIKLNLSLPTALDIESQLFSLKYSFTRFDNLFNPRKGIGITSDVKAGEVSVRRNANIERLRRSDLPDLDFRSLYDTLSVGGVRLQFNTKIDYHFALGKFSTMRTAIQGGMFVSKKDLLQNELYRLGGFQLLRGFNEDTFFSNTFGLGTLEYRLLTGARSHFKVFSDYAWLDLSTNIKSRSWVRALSFGAGMQLDTRGGVFGLALAVGKLGTSSIDFRTPKVHLGFLSRF